MQIELWLNGVVVGTAITDAMGLYSFTDLTAGTGTIGGLSDYELVIPGFASQAPLSNLVVSPASAAANPFDSNGVVAGTDVSFRIAHDDISIAGKNNYSYDFGFAPLLDWGDAPFETTASDDGPRHQVSADLFLGAQVDAEANGQPNATADGDAGADEDGVVFDPSTLVVGQSAEAEATVSNQTAQTAVLWAWIDANRDGQFEAGERVSVDVPPGFAGSLPVTFAGIPLTAGGTTYVRFRLSTDVNANEPIGFASDGEVEDYLVEIDPADEVAQDTSTTSSTAATSSTTTTPVVGANPPSPPPQLALTGPESALQTTGAAALAIAIGLVLVVWSGASRRRSDASR